jgi:hypothetical protein
VATSRGKDFVADEMDPYQLGRLPFVEVTAHSVTEAVAQFI